MEVGCCVRHELHQTDGALGGDGSLPETRFDLGHTLNKRRVDTVSLSGIGEYLLRSGCGFDFSFGSISGGLIYNLNVADFALCKCERSASHTQDEGSIFRGVRIGLEREAVLEMYDFNTRALIRERETESNAE